MKIDYEVKKKMRSKKMGVVGKGNELIHKSIKFSENS